MSIRLAERRDIDAIATLHKNQFADHFLGKYSVQLLARYYQAFLVPSYFLVHETGDQINGFLLGGWANKLSECRQLFVRHNLWRCIGETFLNPALWWQGIHRGLSTNPIPLGKLRKSPRRNATPKMVLLSIAVAEEAKGTGVAVALIDGFEKELRRAHVTSYSLSVVKSNARAIGFYKKMGFKPIQPSDCCMWQLQKSMASNQDFQAVVQSQEGELDCGT